MKHMKASEKHEKEILKFLKKLDFKDVNGGPTFIIGGHQIDACGGHEKTLLIIECTTQEDIKSKITEFRGKLANKIHGFKTHEKYKKYEKHVAILAIKHQKIMRRHIEFALETKARDVYIWDNKFVVYYNELKNSISKYAKFNLLAEINVRPEVEEKISIPSFMTRVGPQGRFILFLFFIDAKLLLKYAYVARRELGYEKFYQRMVKSSRLKEIAKEYINKKKKIFPNSIVVALVDEGWSFEKAKPENIIFPNWLDFGMLSIINSYRNCWIIDGQHRLYSYALTTQPGILAVSAFAKIDEEMQAQYFLDINREAKKVDPNLLWDLTGSLSSRSTQGLISNSIKFLREMKDGFFTDDIKIPSKGPGKFGFNSLCVRLEKMELAKEKLSSVYKQIRNPFWNADIDMFKVNLAKGINQFFQCFFEKIDDEKKILLSTDGYNSLLIILFKLLVVHLKKRPSLEDEKDFFIPLWSYFKECSEDDIKTLVKGLTSEEGLKECRNRLIRLLQQKYDEEFAKGLIKKEPSLAENVAGLEPRMNELINDILTKEVGPEWIKDQKYFRDPEERKKCLDKSKKTGNPAFEFINFNKAVDSIILVKENWEQHFEKIFISKDKFPDKQEFQFYTRKLWEYRSDIFGHKRGSQIVYPKDREDIVRSAYNILKAILDEYSY